MLHQVLRLKDYVSDHLIADCAAWKQGSASTQPKGVGLIKTSSSPQLSIPTEPNDCFKPFILMAFFSLTGEAEDQSLVTVLRDTA